MLNKQEGVAVEVLLVEVSSSLCMKKGKVVFFLYDYIGYMRKSFVPAVHIYPVLQWWIFNSAFFLLSFKTNLLFH